MAAHEIARQFQEQPRKEFMAALENLRFVVAALDKRWAEVEE